MTPSGVASIEALGLRGTLFLAALLAAQLRRIPVAPTRRSTLLVLDALRDLALIQVPWPADRWRIRPDAEVTPIEDLQWAFAWSTHERRHLLPVLEDQLGDMAHDVELADAKLELWDELALWVLGRQYRGTCLHQAQVWMGLGNAVECVVQCHGVDRPGRYPCTQQQPSGQRRTSHLHSNTPEVQTKG